MDIGLSKWMYLLKSDFKLKIVLHVLLMGFNTTGLIYMVSSETFIKLSVKHWEDEIKGISEQLLKQRYIGST